MVSSSRDFLLLPTTFTSHLVLFWHTCHSSTHGQLYTPNCWITYYAFTARTDGHFSGPAATMGSQLLLRWDNHLPSFACSMKECFDDGDLTDLTISCQGRVLHCHKLVLSVASPHFKQLLKVGVVSAGWGGGMVFLLTSLLIGLASRPIQRLRIRNCTCMIT